VSERMVLGPLMAKDSRVVQRLARSRKVAQREGRMQNAESHLAGKAESRKRAGPKTTNY